MKNSRERPPVYTVWEEFCGWTFDHTAKIPKSQRFTFGQKIDSITLGILLMIVTCIYSKDMVMGFELFLFKVFFFLGFIENGLIMKQKLMINGYTL